MELKRRTCTEKGSVERLLIVPYGIETLQQGKDVDLSNPFNRTLWN